MTMMTELLPLRCEFTHLYLALIKGQNFRLPFLVSASVIGARGRLKAILEACRVTSYGVASMVPCEDFQGFISWPSELCFPRSMQMEDLSTLNPLPSPNPYPTSATQWFYCSKWPCLGPCCNFLQHHSRILPSVIVTAIVLSSLNPTDLLNLTQLLFTILNSFLFRGLKL